MTENTGEKIKKYARNFSEIFSDQEEYPSSSDCSEFDKENDKYYTKVHNSEKMLNKEQKYNDYLDDESTGYMNDDENSDIDSIYERAEDNDSIS